MARGFLEADLHPSVPDTELALRFTPGPGFYVGDGLLPSRPVNKKNDYLRQFGKGNLLRKRDLKVSGRGALAKVQFQFEQSVNYFCVDLGVSVFCDNGERAQADSIVQYDNEQTFTAQEAFSVNQEFMILGTLRDPNVMTQNYTLGATEYFNDYNATGDGPFRILKNALESVIIGTGGKAGNPQSPGTLRIVMHRWTWSYLSEHPDFLGAAPVHTTPAGVQAMSPQQVLKKLGMDESAISSGKVVIEITGGFYNDATEGAADDWKSFIGRDIIIAYTEPPGPRSMSLGYTMCWAGPQKDGSPSGLPRVAYRVPMPWEGSHGGDLVKIVGSMDAIIANPESGFLIKNALDPALVRQKL